MAAALSVDWFLIFFFYPRILLLNFINFLLFLQL